jgi:hypothetical protein
MKFLQGILAKYINLDQCVLILFLQGSSSKSLPPVLYVSETWSLILKIIHKLQICEEKVHRKISETVSGQFRILHNGELS